MAVNPVIMIEEGSVPSHDEMKQFIKDMQIFAENMDVTSLEAFKKITSLYADAKSWERIIEQKRKEANTPEQQIINARNDRAREVTEPLKHIQEICKRKADDYQKHLERERKKEEEKIQVAADLFDEVMPYVPPVSQSHRGDGAVAYTRTETKFRLIDLSLVPLRYLMIDEDKIKRDIKLGITEISGLEIYTQKTTQLKTR